jgi:uncharacterized protein (TIGR03545 family)
MRKKYLFYLLVPVVLALIFVFFFLDSFVESSIEEAGEEITGAKVEIDNLKVHFIPVGVEWDAMHVANPNATWENLFETKKVKFEMDANQLLRGKYIIETIEMHNLVIGTKRTTDGALSAGKRKQSVLSSAEKNFSRLAEDALKKTLGTNPVFDITKLKHGFNPDSLIAAFDLKSVKNIDTLKRKVDYAVTKWNGMKNDYERTKNKVTEIESQIKAINVNELNNAQNILSAVSTVDNAIKTVNDVTAVVNKNTAVVSNMVNTTISSIDSIDNFIKYDFERLKNAAHLPSISMPGVAQLLVGSEMYERIKKYLYWVDAARTNIAKYQGEPEIEKPARFKGQDIKFPVDRGYPKFWIKNILLTYGDDDKTIINTFKAKGEAKNITDNQKITGMPMTINLEGYGNDNRKLTLKGLFDRRKAVPLDEYTAKLAGVPVGSFKLGKSDFLPSNISNSVMATTLSISIPGDSFDARIKFDLSNVMVNFQSAPKNIAESIVQGVLKGINSFNVEFRLWNTGGAFDAALATDLDEKIAKQLSTVIGAEFQKLQDDLKAKLYAYVDKEKVKFEKQYGAKINEVKNQLESYQSIINDKTGFIEGKKKELTDKLNQEKNNLIQDKIKGLFKRK